jgi:hypothetical protein
MTGFVQAFAFEAAGDVEEDHVGPVVFRIEGDDKRAAIRREGGIENGSRHAQPMHAEPSDGPRGQRGLFLRRRNGRDQKHPAERQANVVHDAIPFRDKISTIVTTAHAGSNKFSHAPRLLLGCVRRSGASAGRNKLTQRRKGAKKEQVSM